MKLTAIILLTVSLHVAARTEGQTVTLKEKKATLEKIFVEIRKQTGFNFFYGDGVLKNSKPVTIEVYNVPVKEALEICFKDQPFSFAIEGSTIVVRSEPNKKNRTKTLQDELSQTLNEKKIDITGRVVNESGNPVSGVTVTIKGTNTVTTTNNDGEFSLSSIDPDAVLVFTHVSMETFEVKVSGKTQLAINLRTKISALGDVTITVNTGYEKIPKERATGAFGFVNNEELNRRVGPDIVSRLEGVATGILFDRRGSPPSQTTVNKDNILVRGLSSISESRSRPLIILNNFPYEGDINNINPNDIVSVTILKDAAAASIWGAKAANGVIVLTTKEGSYNKAPQITLITNYNYIPKPDLFHYNRMSSSDFIDVETFLFNNDFFNDDLSNNFNYPVVTPVVEILDKRRNNLISADDSASQIDALRGNDVRNDFSKHFYRRSLNQQYNLNVSGGGQFVKYFLSGGFDRNPNVLVGNEVNRITLYSNTSIQATKHLNVNLGLNYNNAFSKLNSLNDIGTQAYNISPSRNLYPYAKFLNADGSFIPIAKDYRSGYTDTAGNGQLLNWKYNPLEELNNADNSSKFQETVVNLGLNYKFSNSLQIAGNYQYQSAYNTLRYYYTAETYYTRNLINLFSQIDANGVRRIIPFGGILRMTSENVKSHMGRVQVNYTKSFADRHDVAVLGGGEIREIVSTSSSQRSYGYDDNLLITAPVDYANDYILYGNQGIGRIDPGEDFLKVTDHLVSAFVNASYTYDKTYTLSASGRRDASNLFGVDLKNKWKPFWTIGAAWNISNEAFFESSIMPFLRLRASYGYQGNVNNSISPYTIITYAGFNSPINNLPTAIVTNPANPGLTWETTRQLNIGLDFRGFNNRIAGTVDFFTKRSYDLLLSAINDPTSGVSSLTKNSAAISGKGLEFSIKTDNIDGRNFKWKSEILFSYATYKVTDYLLDDQRIARSFASDNRFIVLKGKSPYSLYSYRFGGLDADGNPQGFDGKNLTTNYVSIFRQRPDTASLVYHGSSVPTTWGFFNNIFSYKDLSLVISLSYSLGYYFRKSTISYYDLYYSGRQHQDFAKRWRNPGDENSTTVPAMPYPLSNSRRDEFYAFSSANVLKADNIRLQNIKISYSIGREKYRRIPVQGIQIYATANNLGIIWRANKEGLDPDIDFGNAPYPILRSIAFGVSVNF